jgi:hypothetical protein
MRVLHLPTSVGGNAWGLAQGERSLGLLSDVLIAFDNYLSYPADRVLFKTAPSGPLGTLVSFLRISLEVARIRKAYDVFHFNFGTTPLNLSRIGLPLFDLPFYHGKIVVTYNGCDARQKLLTMKRVPFSACHNDDCYGGLCGHSRYEKTKRKKIAMFDKHAASIFALNPDLKYFLPERARFLPYTVTQWNTLETLPERNMNGHLTIAHAPTNRGTKGSQIILDVLSRLQKEYAGRITVLVVENTSHARAVELYQQADLVIDQIMIGWYGGFAVEAMKMGIPVVAYISPDDLRFLPPEMAEDCKKAIVNANPLNLYDVIQGIAENPSVLTGYRQAALDYVHRWHNPRYVAGITKAAYEEK